MSKVNAHVAGAKLASLFAAFVLFAPVALATALQAAQIVG
jgi:hypothetical protein